MREYRIVELRRLGLYPIFYVILSSISSAEREAMNRTKELIVDTFWEILEEKPYSKITVQEIADRCQVNRNTFYYHFQDIPTLAANSVQDWMDDVIRRKEVFGSPVKCLTYMAEECTKRKKAFFHLYRSAQKDNLLWYMNKMGDHVIRSYMDNTPNHSSDSQEVKEVLIRYYKCTFIGIVLDWLEEDGSYDLVEFYEKTCNLIETIQRKEL